MKALIFAAGLGTRLRPITDTIPKALVPFCGGTLLSHVIETLSAAGVDDIVINAHHFAEKIIAYLAENDNFGKHISVSWEKEQALETGGGLKYAEPLLRGSGSFLVHNVDIVSDLDVKGLLAAARPDALVTMLVSERKTSRYLLFDPQMRLAGWTNVDTGEVRTPYPDLDPASCRKLAFGCVYVVSDAIFPLLSGWPEKFSIMDFFIQSCAEHPIYGYVQEGLRLVDVGKPDTLKEAQEFYSSIR